MTFFYFWENPSLQHVQMEHHLAEKGTLKNNHLNLTAADHERKFLSVRTFSAKIFSFHVVLVG